MGYGHFICICPGALGSGEFGHRFMCEIKHGSNPGMESGAVAGPALRPQHQEHSGTNRDADGDGREEGHEQTSAPEVLERSFLLRGSVGGRAKAQRLG
jgi:hypothetical protein